MNTPLLDGDTVFSPDFWVWFAGNILMLPGRGLYQLLFGYSEQSVFFTGTIGWLMICSAVLLWRFLKRPSKGENDVQLTRADVVMMKIKSLLQQIRIAINAAMQRFTVMAETAPETETATETIWSSRAPRRLLFIVCSVAWFSAAILVIPLFKLILHYQDWVKLVAFNESVSPNLYTITLRTLACIGLFFGFFYRPRIKPTTNTSRIATAAWIACVITFFQAFATIWSFMARNGGDGSNLAGIILFPMKLFNAAENSLLVAAAALAFGALMAYLMPKFIHNLAYVKAANSE